MPLVHELAHVLPVLCFSVDLAVSIIQIRRGYWCLLSHVVLLVVDIQVIVKKVSVSLLSECDYYVRTPLMVGVLSRFQGD